MTSKTRWKPSQSRSTARTSLPSRPTWRSSGRTIALLVLRRTRPVSSNTWKAALFDTCSSTFKLKLRPPSAPFCRCSAIGKASPTNPSCASCARSGRRKVASFSPKPRPRPVCFRSRLLPSARLLPPGPSPSLQALTRCPQRRLSRRSASSLPRMLHSTRSASPRASASRTSRSAAVGGPSVSLLMMRPLLTRPLSRSTRG